MMVQEHYCMFVKWSKGIFFILFFFFTNGMLVRDDNEMVIASKVWWSSTLKMNNMLKANYVLKVMNLSNQLRRLFGLS